MRWGPGSAGLRKGKGVGWACAEAMAKRASAVVRVSFIAYLWLLMLAWGVESI